MRAFIMSIWASFALVWSWSGGVLGLDSMQVAKILRYDANQKQWFAPNHLPQLALQLSFDKAKLQKIVIENPRLFAVEDLWGFLDWVGESSAWTEVNLKGYTEKPLKKHLKGAEHAWVNRSHRAEFVLATLHSRGISSYLRLSLLPNQILTGKAPQLVCNFSGHPQDFSDFKLLGTALCLDGQGDCVMVHGDDSRLKITLNATRLRMEYHNPDTENLPMVPNFTRLSVQLQNELIDDYGAYFKHEQSLAVRAFIETAPNLFNWQSWHWLESVSANKIHPQILREILQLSNPPAEILLYSEKCSDGRQMQVLSNGQGRLILSVE